MHVSDLLSVNTTRQLSFEKTITTSEKYLQAARLSWCGAGVVRENMRSASSNFFSFTDVDWQERPNERTCQFPASKPTTDAGSQCINQEADAFTLYEHMSPTKKPSPGSHHVSNQQRFLVNKKTWGPTTYPKYLCVPIQVFNQGLATASSTKRLVNPQPSNQRNHQCWLPQCPQPRNRPFRNYFLLPQCSNNGSNTQSSTRKPVPTPAPTMSPTLSPDKSPAKKPTTALPRLQPR